jgi:glycogen operon protein
MFRKKTFFTGRKAGGSGARDVTWLRPDGRAMSRRDWDNPNRAAIAVLLCGEAIGEIEPSGRPVGDDTFVLLINAHDKQITFNLPASARPCELLLSTAEPVTCAGEGQPVRGHRFCLEARSLALLIHRGAMVRL